MPTATHLPPPVNHVFVDFENVHKVDLAVIGSKAAGTHWTKSRRVGRVGPVGRVGRAGTE